MHICEGRLTVVPDNTTPGSSGRLCLQLPEEFGTEAGSKFKQVGNFGDDGGAMFIRAGEGTTLTPRRQMWWKNGVRDQKVREDWKVTIYVLEDFLFVVWLYSRIGTTRQLPPVQDVLF